MRERAEGQSREGLVGLVGGFGYLHQVKWEATGATSRLAHLSNESVYLLVENRLEYNKGPSRGINQKALEIILERKKK